jgi:23S rRNA pseudouridine2605 synthase
MHPRFGVEREYAVRVLGTLTDEERSRLLEGVEIEGQPAAFRSIDDGGGEGANHWYRVVITEGRNREVRKLFDSVGKAVSRLIRIRYGSVVLPKGLRRGMWVDLGVHDVKVLRAATGMPRREDAQAARDEERRGRRGGRRGRGGRGEVDARRRPQPGRETPAHLDGDGDDDHVGPIPNPLQQTYDKRAFQLARKQQREYSDDGPIPNPLQQTFDKRAIQGERTAPRIHDDDAHDHDDHEETGPIPNPLQQTYDKRFSHGHGPKAGGGSKKPRRKAGGAKPRAGGPGGSGGGGGGQPDPLRTAVGYIGADAFHKKGRGGPRGGKGGRPGGKGGRNR